MKKFTKKVLAAFLSVLMAVCAVATPAMAYEKPEQSGKKAEYIEGEVIVVLKETAPKSYLMAGRAVSNYGKGLKVNSSFSYNKKNGKIRALVLKSDNRKTADIIKELKKNEQVKYAFPNYVVKASALTNDTYSNYQWALDNKGINGGASGLDTNADALWDKASASEKERVVAIVDTGIDYNHEDLKDVLWENPHGSKLVGKYGYDFTGTIKDGSPFDDNGHGTHCAGIIAASADNEKGISGINKANTKIMACKFLDEDGFGSTDAALAAFEYISRAIDLGTNVVAINNSWGGVGDLAEQELFDEIFDAFGEKGAISVVSAGNESTDLSEYDNEEMVFWYGENYRTTPASSLSEYCLTVAATNEKDELADFSNYSTDFVDIAAPGCDILSSVSYNCFNPSIYSAEQQAELCKNFQNFDGTFTSGDFGYPGFIPAATESSELYDHLGINKEITQSADGFGADSKAMRINLKDIVVNENSDGDYENYSVYAFEIPFTLDDETKPYSISFMVKADNDLFGVVGDFPADFDIAKNIEDAAFDDYLWGSSDGGYWKHQYINVNQSEKGYQKKYKGKERKLVFVVESYKTDTYFQLDDLAVSNQSASADSFGKYDFYNGTSMAAPYVSGAVALVSNAYPDADAAEVINIVKNTGRISSSLEGKTENSRVLSLDNSENTPSMITSAKYNEAGDVEVKGSFKNDTSFSINGSAVTPKEITSGKAVFADTSYNTKKVEITAENAFGADSISVLLSKKPTPKKSKKLIGSPMMPLGMGYYMPMGAISIPAGTKSYFVGETGEIGSVYYDEMEDGYIYEDVFPQLDSSKLFKEPKAVSFKTAAYLDSKIYFTALNEVFSSYMDVVIGYEGVFGYYDLNSGKTVKLCEIPDATALGETLAVYNGELYLIGGYDWESNTFSKDVYKYNTSKKSFAKTAYSLPEGRAFTSFIQFEGKLIGAYGANETGELPKFITFDGSKWSTSALNIASDDYDTYYFDNEINVYYGNLGYSGGGIYLNGAYIYGYGDTYNYNASTDKLTASKYSFSNEIGKGKLIATTLPGCFIGYPIEDAEGVGTAGSNYVGGEEGEEDFLSGYCYSITNSYAKLDESAMTHAYISSAYEPYYAYGDKLTFNVAPESGYVITSISANGVKLSDNSTKASIIFKNANVSITAKTKKVAPNKVTGVKVKKTSKSCTVSWKKPERAQGYQVQTYKNGKWVTVKTVTSGNTLKCTVSKSKAGKKFRVRATSKYNGKTYYGAWSAAVKS